MNDDPHYKIRPLIDCLNENGKWFVSRSQDFSIDELVVSSGKPNLPTPLIGDSPARCGYKVRQNF